MSDTPPFDGILDRLKSHADAAFDLIAEAGACIEHQMNRIAELEAELETERMRLTACGVVALSNTPTTAAEQRKMHPDYWSDSCAAVADAVDREMKLRAALAEAQKDAARWRWAESHATSYTLGNTGDTVWQVRCGVNASDTSMTAAVDAAMQEGER